MPIEARDPLATYRQHLQEAKERAFIRWRASGYRSVADYNTFIAAFEMLLPQK